MTPPGDQFGRGRFVRHIDLHVERLDGPNAGKLRVSSPHARGWAATVRGPEQMWAALHEAVTEATIAGYARWKGVRYDHDALTADDDPTEPSAPPAADSRRVSYARGAIARPDHVDPADWRPNPDGTWTNPRSGKRWRAHTRTVTQVLEKRRREGLPLSYAEYVARSGEEAL